MPESASTYLILAAAAFCAGAVNSIAGGGTLLTFPALTVVVSEVVANATSTVALLPGAFAGAFGYRKELAAGRGFAARMFAPSLAGGFLGAWLVSRDEQAFATLVPWLILLAAGLFAAQPLIGKLLRRPHGGTTPPTARLAAGLIAAQFVIAVYGGYFGAGIGILMLTSLSFLGVGDIHRANAVKTFLAAVINAASVVVFAWGGQIRWDCAAAMAGAAVLGGYGGARAARKLPAAAVRWVVIGIGFGLSGYYFWKQTGG
ncbi:MAG: sulfite exporter TauE/SafE family protein [Fimbriiglobus sp.]